MVRQLKVPVGFSADLPFGPMPQIGCPRVLCKTGGRQEESIATTCPGEELGGSGYGSLVLPPRYPLSAINNGGDNHDRNDEGGGGDCSERGVICGLAEC